MRLRLGFGSVASALLAFGLMAGRAEAGTITFTLDCTIVTAAVCTPGGSFGTITLSDNALDPTRVDISVVITAPVVDDVFEGIDEFYLNYNTSTGPSTTLRQFRLVPIDTAAGVNGTSFVTLPGTVDYDQDDHGPPSNGNTLDFTLDPTNPPLFPITSFTGSLLLRTSSAGGVSTAQFNLDPEMFDLVSPTSGLYAAVQGVPLGGLFRVGALSSDHGANTIAAVPEPGSLLLMGTGLLALATLARRRRT